MVKRDDFIVDDPDELDDSSDNDDLFDTCCSLCDNGGDILWYLLLLLTPTFYFYMFDCLGRKWIEKGPIRPKKVWIGFGPKIFIPKNFRLDLILCPTFLCTLISLGVGNARLINSSAHVAHAGLIV